jgi:hypothetical protein
MLLVAILATSVVDHVSIFNFWWTLCRPVPYPPWTMCILIKNNRPLQQDCMCWTPPPIADRYKIYTPPIAGQCIARCPFCTHTKCFKDRQLLDPGEVHSPVGVPRLSRMVEEIDFCETSFKLLNGS